MKTLFNILFVLIISSSYAQEPDAPLVSLSLQPYWGFHSVKSYYHKGWAYGSDNHGEFASGISVTINHQVERLSFGLGADIMRLHDKKRKGNAILIPSLFARFEYINYPKVSGIFNTGITYGIETGRYQPFFSLGPRFFIKKKNKQSKISISPILKLQLPEITYHYSTDFRTDSPRTYRYEKVWKTKSILISIIIQLKKTKPNKS